MNWLVQRVLLEINNATLTLRYRIELVLIDHDKISTTPFLQIFEKIKVFQYIQIEIEFYESKSNINKTYEFI